ncbi:hypothetical protein BC833DRAFT_600874 [Globomyces pollinis-pini]|nr:hypothetical protein BC833DRAFT_600874 [Globomyces pollinis-pini]
MSVNDVFLPALPNTDIVTIRPPTQSIEAINERPSIRPIDIITIRPGMMADVNDSSKSLSVNEPIRSGRFNEMRGYSRNTNYSFRTTDLNHKPAPRNYSANTNRTTNTKQTDDQSILTSKNSVVTKSITTKLINKIVEIHNEKSHKPPMTNYWALPVDKKSIVEICAKNNQMKSFKFKQHEQVKSVKSEKPKLYVLSDRQNRKISKVTEILRGKDYERNEDIQLENALKKLHFSLPSIKKNRAKSSKILLNDMPRPNTSIVVIDKEELNNIPDLDDFSYKQHLALAGRSIKKRPNQDMLQDIETIELTGDALMSQNKRAEVRTMARNPHRPKLLGMKQRTMLETMTAVGISRMIQAGYEYDFKMVKNKQYQETRIQVTKQKITNYFSKLVTKERRNQIHPEYVNPVKLSPIKN